MNHQMRILQVNKFLFPHAGADIVALQARRLLQKAGHTVVSFGMDDPRTIPGIPRATLAPARDFDASAPRLARARDALSTIYSPAARHRLSTLLDRHPVDLAHLHNIYHQLTFSIVDELRERDIPVVMTVHDWKIACPAYTLYRDGAPCRRCVRRTVTWPAVTGRCIKGSLAGSLIGALGATFDAARRAYEGIDRFIVPSEFARSIVEQAGIGPERVDLIRNSVPDRGPPTTRSEPTVLYAGRLAPEKGIRLLLEAIRHASPEARIEICGDGPLTTDIELLAATDPRVTYHGRLRPDAVAQRMEVARAIVLPSVWEENCPLAVLEAKSRGRGAIVTARGGLPELVGNEKTGWVVAPDDPVALGHAISRVCSEGRNAAAVGARAFEDFLANFTEARYFGELLETYSRVLNKHSFNRE